MWLFERFSGDVLPERRRLGTGYVIAVVVGIALGVLLGLRPALRRTVSPMVEFLRAIPAPALIPFAILVLGVENDAKVFLIAVVCVFPILLNTIDGVAGVKPTLLDTTTSIASAGSTGCATSCCPPPRPRSSPGCGRGCRCR